MLSLVKFVTLAVLARGLVAVPSAGNDTISKRAGVTVTVNLGTTYQTMDGFGFSQAFGHANDLHALPATQQKQALDLLFSPTTGAGLTILRNRIGSGGSGDSIEPTSPGSSSGTPKYTWDGSEGYQVWLSQQALNYGVKTIYADAWSAPGFMKTNGKDSNGGYLCGVTGESCSSGDWKQAYANFLVQYLKYYQQAGVTISHVGFLNEPEYTTTYSSMLSSGQQAADFIKVLYPTIKNAGLSTKITCCDSEGWNDQKTMTAALISAGVESQLGVITSHSYSSSPNTAISTSLNVWETEYADLDGAWTDAWHSSGAVGEGLVWAQKIYSCVVGANCSGYLYWIGIWNNCNTNVSLMRITSGNVIDVSKRLWAFAMWSRFVRPGAVRVGTSGSGTGLSFAAFKNTDGTVTVQVINVGNSAQTVNVAVNGLTTVSVKAYITDNKNSVATLAASISGGQATASVPAYAMVAFVVSGTGSGSSSSSTTATTTTITTKTTTITSSSTSTTSSTPTGGCAALYGQCGGSGWTGSTCCSSGTCKYSNDYYSQCL